MLPQSRTIRTVYFTHIDPLALGPEFEIRFVQGNDHETGELLGHAGEGLDIDHETLPVDRALMGLMAWNDQWFALQFIWQLKCRIARRILLSVACLI